MQEPQKMHIWSVDWEDPLEKEMATSSRMFAWKIPSAEKPGGHSPLGLKGLDVTERTCVHAHRSISLSAPVTLACFLAHCRSAHSPHWTFTLALLLCLECSSHRYSLVITHLLQVSVNLTVWKRPTLTTILKLPPDLPYLCKAPSTFPFFFSIVFTTV